MGCTDSQREDKAGGVGASGAQGSHHSHQSKQGVWVTVFDHGAVEKAEGCTEGLGAGSQGVSEMNSQPEEKKKGKIKKMRRIT